MLQYNKALDASDAVADGEAEEEADVARAARRAARVAAGGDASSSGDEDSGDEGEEEEEGREEEMELNYESDEARRTCSTDFDFDLIDCCAGVFARAPQVLSYAVQLVASCYLYESPALTDVGLIGVGYLF